MAEKKTAVEAAPVKYVNRLEKKYKEEIRPALVKEFNYSTIMMAPRLEKIVINMGVGDATSNSKALDDAVADLTFFMFRNSDTGEINVVYSRRSGDYGLLVPEME